MCIAINGNKSCGKNLFNQNQNEAIPRTAVENNSKLEMVLCSKDISVQETALCSDKFTDIFGIVDFAVSEIQ